MHAYIQAYIYLPTCMVKKYKYCFCIIRTGVVYQGRNIYKWVQCVLSDEKLIHGFNFQHHSYLTILINHQVATVHTKKN